MKLFCVLVVALAAALALCGGVSSGAQVRSKTGIVILPGQAPDASAEADRFAREDAAEANERAQALLASTEIPVVGSLDNEAEGLANAGRVGAMPRFAETTYKGQTVRGGNAHDADNHATVKKTEDAAHHEADSGAKKGGDAHAHTEEPAAAKGGHQEAKKGAAPAEKDEATKNEDVVHHAAEEAAHQADEKAKHDGGEGAGQQDTHHSKGASAPDKIPVLPPLPAPMTKKFTPLCDFTAERGLCLYGGQKVIVRDANPLDIVGSWSFDDAHCLDSSPFANHGATVVSAGPGHMSKGASALFDGATWLEVPSSESLAQCKSHFGALFWIYLVPDQSNGLNIDCTVTMLGTPPQDSRAETESDGGAMGSAGAIFHLLTNPMTGQLTLHSDQGHVVVKSFARLGFSQWHHIGVSADDKTVSLFVNGVLDNSADRPAGVEKNDYPMSQLYMGRAPFDPLPCAVPMLLDDFQLYARELDTFEVQADAWPALGSQEAGAVVLGCADKKLGTASCTFSEVTCPTGYRLCSQLEMYAGGFETGKKMGWLTYETPYHVRDHESQADEKKRALCCLS